MEIRRRDFLTSLGLVASAGLVRIQAQQPDPATPRPPKREVPHRKVKTTNLFKAPPGYPNAVAIAPEGLWVAEQKNRLRQGRPTLSGSLLAARLERETAQDGSQRVLQHQWHGVRRWLCLDGREWRPGRGGHLPDRHELQDRLATGRSRWDQSTMVEAATA